MGDRKSLSSHVLGRFTPYEEATIEAAIARSVEAIEVFVEVGIVAAMDRYNRKDDKSDKSNESEDN